jgi:hypothetical protein
VISKYSWELLTKVYGLDPSRLYVTYFEGHPAGGLEPDTEAKELWLAAGVPEDHIVPGNLKVRLLRAMAFSIMPGLLYCALRMSRLLAAETRGAEYNLGVLGCVLTILPPGQFLGDGRHRPLRSMQRDPRRQNRWQKCCTPRQYVKAYEAFWGCANSLCVDQDDPNVIEIWNVSEDAFFFIPSHVILLEVIHMAHQGRNRIKMT